MSKETVPRRLLTDEMVAWQGAYKRARKIAKASGMAGFGFRDILKQSLFQMKSLLDSQPRDKLKELAQQPEEEGARE